MGSTLRRRDDDNERSKRMWQLCNYLFGPNRGRKKKLDLNYEKESNSYWKYAGIGSDTARLVKSVFVPHVE